jgi:hypothetical protein
MLNGTSNIFRDELNPDERIIWSGQPRQGLLLRPSDALMIPFSLLWGGFAIFWEVSAINMSWGDGSPNPVGFIFPLFGLPFVLAGLYAIFGRFFVDRVRRAKTYYALTNQRAIIISGLINPSVRSIDYRKLPEINFNAWKEGWGTINFGTPYPWERFYTSGAFPGFGRHEITPKFDLIADARSVYQQLKRLQREPSD